VTFVFFRASSVSAALSVLRGMAGLNGVTIPYAIGLRLGGFGAWLERLGFMYDWSSGSHLIESLIWLGVLFVIVMALPNSLELLAPYRPALDFQRPEAQAGEPREAESAMDRLSRPDIVRSRLGPALVATLAMAGVLGLHHASGFLYWQF
jgi:alginate O-acetyltransferase complex protein AlgI